MEKRTLSKSCFDRMHPNTIECPYGVHLEGDVGPEACECRFRQHERARDWGQSPPHPESETRSE